MTGRLVTIAYAWLVGAAITWLFCVPPNPPFPHPDAAGIEYPIYCLALWPLVAFENITSHHQR